MAPPPPPPASSSFGFKRGFLNNTNSSSTLSSSVRSATTTTATIVPSATIQTTRASSTSEAVIATATTEAPQSPPPRTEDPQDECVLCCYPLPLEEHESVYHECCGHVICNGCTVARRRTLDIGTNVKKPIKGSKEEEEEFMLILCSEWPIVCPFCRKGVPENDTEFLKRLYRRIDEYNDPRAMNMLGFYYLKGESGLTRNLKKAEEFFKRSYALGDPVAAHHLSGLHREHFQNKVLSIQYAEEGARRGDCSCMTFLAYCAARSGNWEEATRQYMMAARSGNDIAMKKIMEFYQIKLLSKDDFATTLRAHKAANDKGKNEAREYAMRHKKFKAKMISAGRISQT